MEKLVLKLEENCFHDNKIRRTRKKKKPELNYAQSDLAGVTVADKAIIDELTDEINTYQDEIDLINHTKKCDLCMCELYLCLTRYYPNRIPWWLLADDDLPESISYNVDVEIYEVDLPSISNYIISSYWDFNDESDKSTNLYITDRMNWAEQYLSIVIDLLMDLRKSYEETRW